MDMREWFKQAKYGMMIHWGLYSQAGINKQNYNLGALGAGEHSFVIAPDVSENIYIVRVVAGQYKYQTIIFRKR